MAKTTLENFIVYKGNSFKGRLTIEMVSSERITLKGTLFLSTSFEDIKPKEYFAWEFS